MAKQAPGHRILIKPDPIKKETDWGFIVDVDERNAKINTVTGEVVSIGPTAWMAYDYYKPDGSRNEKWQPWCKIGDRVYFSKYAAAWVKIGTEEYVMVNDQDIVMPIDPEDKINE